MASPTNNTSTQTVHVGFMPLVDCAPLAVAKTLKFDVEEGISLQLHKEVSWANIRDKVIVGHFDCAQMLAPMPIASTLGLNHVREAIIAPLTLSINGNAITVGKSVSTHMSDVGKTLGETNANGSNAGATLAQVILERLKTSSRPLTFGIVYPYSCQHYELIDWLGRTGNIKESQIRIVGLPPSMMVESLAAGQIDGFCAGEPWSSVAEDQQLGVIIATKAEVWGRAPEKVLGVRLSWAEQNQPALYALMRSVLRAIEWLSEPNNVHEAAVLLAGDEYLGLDASLIERSLSTHHRSQVENPANQPATLLGFPKGAESCPSLMHMSWILSMMYKTGQIERAKDFTFVLDEATRPDLWHTATGGALGTDDAREEELARVMGVTGKKPSDLLDRVRQSS